MEASNREKLLKPGTILAHFKRAMSPKTDPYQYLYQIVGEAAHTETGERLVVYRALYGSKGLYCRPKEMFLSPVDRAKYPDAAQQWRFEYFCYCLEDLPQKLSQ